jgi:exonuclease III
MCPRIGYVIVIASSNESRTLVLRVFTQRVFLTIMKLLSLNIQHGGRTRVDLLLKRILSHDAEVVVLTEFHQEASGEKIITCLSEAGYRCASTTGVLPKTNTVLIASRLPFVIVPLPALLAEDNPRALLARFEKFAVLGVYFAQKEEKRSLFDFIRVHGIGLLGTRGLVTGDFNTGRAFLDEKGRSFACIDCFEDLERLGLVDSWRSRNPTGQEHSWYSNFGNGFRIDHVFSTPALDGAITRIGYDHAPRTTKETDHSALITEFAF